MEELRRGSGSETGSGAGTESGTGPGAKSGAVQTGDIGNKPGPRKCAASTKKIGEEGKGNREQTKFFVDVSGEKESMDLIFGLLEKVNNKELGRPITFKDLSLAGLSKLDDKDLKRISESSLTEMEKVERARQEFNQKNGTTLTMGEFLVRQLKIN